MLSFPKLKNLVFKTYWLVNLSKTLFKFECSLSEVLKHITFGHNLNKIITF